MLIYLLKEKINQKKKRNSVYNYSCYEITLGTGDRIQCSFIEERKAG